MISRVALSLAMVFALAGALPGQARADWGDRPNPAEYEQELSPHGYWVDAPGYGRVWRPYVGWEWRPYVDGQWIWTSYGWTWSSPEPWGWTFHYGRWGFTPSYGWVWTPGYVWGPAWVDWYWGDGYVGWVPLAPVGFAIVPGYWTYVHTYSFCAPRISNVVVYHNRLPRYVVHHREQGWGYRRAPDYRDIEHVSRHRIVRASDRPRDSVAPWIRHRVERGEPVRERVVDRGRERVVEHRGGRLDGDRRDRMADRDGGRFDVDRRDRGGAMDHDGGRLGGAQRRERPPVSDDDWSRAGRGDHGGGRMSDRGVERDDRTGSRARPGHRFDNDDAGGRIIDVPRGRVDTRRNLDADPNTVRPSPRRESGSRWTTREPGVVERAGPTEGQRPPMGHGGAPPSSSYRSSQPGGGMVMEAPRGGGMGGGNPPMQHGGGSAPAPSRGGSPSGSRGGGGHDGSGGSRGGGGHMMVR